MENVAERLLNPTVIVTMIAAGIAYGGFLWSLNVRPHVRLWAAAVVPGFLFLAVIWSIRAAQGVAAATYIAMIVDWLIFAHSGYISVLVARRVRRRKATP